jgi:mannosyltransferase OCH1-like enzyme
LRYFLLHHYGGIYIDLDLSPYRSLTPLLSYPSIACLTSPTGISNDILGSTPQHPFFTLVIERLSEYNRHWGLPYITVMYSTGPLFLSVVWIEFLRRGVPGLGTAVARVRLLPKDGTNGDSYGFFKNVQGGSWHGRDMEVIFWMGRHWFLVTLLGFVIGFAVVGVLWRVLRACAGLWRRERWWDRIRAARKLQELG